MILYSIVPHHIVFQDTFEKEVKTKEIRYRGENVIVALLENNQFRIVRVISTQPKTYLDLGLQPGTVI